jgi:hypothetical protein
MQLPSGRAFEAKPPWRPSARSLRIWGDSYCGEPGRELDRAEAALREKILDGSLPRKQAEDIQASRKVGLSELSWEEEAWSGCVGLWVPVGAWLRWSSGLSPCMSASAGPGAPLRINSSFLQHARVSWPGAVGRRRAVSEQRGLHRALGRAGPVVS